VWSLFQLIVGRTSQFVTKRNPGVEFFVWKAQENARSKNSTPCATNSGINTSILVEKYRNPRTVSTRIPVQVYGDIVKCSTKIPLGWKFLGNVPVPLPGRFERYQAPVAVFSVVVPGYWYLVPGTVPTLLVATNLHSSDWVALVVISGHGLRKFGGC
jgi:hypothetical protein